MEFHHEEGPETTALSRTTSMFRRSTQLRWLIRSLRESVCAPTNTPGVRSASAFLEAAVSTSSSATAAAPSMAAPCRLRPDHQGRVDARSHQRVIPSGVANARYAFANFWNASTELACRITGFAGRPTSSLTRVPRSTQLCGMWPPRWKPFEASPSVTSHEATYWRPVTSGSPTPDSSSSSMRVSTFRIHGNSPCPRTCTSSPWGSRRSAGPGCVNITTRGTTIPPYRDEQRAWYDALRDLLPSLEDLQATVRLYARDLTWCSLDPDNTTATTFSAFRPCCIRDVLPPAEQWLKSAPPLSERHRPCAWRWSFRS